ncbi:hypothetical protein [Roseibium sp.]|uniref:hypothetical protein n=1 Tax=Roseibium sp. TaxID=1936156 RepID=UPI003BAFFE0C
MSEETNQVPRQGDLDIGAMRRLCTYCIAIGVQIDDKLVDRLYRLDNSHGSEENQAEATKILKEITAATKPITILTVPSFTPEDVKRYKNSILNIAIWALGGLAFTTAICIVFRTSILSDPDCQASYWCYPTWSIAIILFGTALGVIGAACAELFAASAYSTSDVAAHFDEYQGKSRIILGSILGWVVTLTISRSYLDVVFNFQSTEDQSALEISHYAMILLPFLMGYSSGLVSTLLRNLISAAQAMFGASSSRG